MSHFFTLFTELVVSLYVSRTLSLNAPRKKGSENKVEGTTCAAQVCCHCAGLTSSFPEPRLASDESSQQTACFTAYWIAQEKRKKKKAQMQLPAISRGSAHYFHFLFL